MPAAPWPCAPPGSASRRCTCACARPGGSCTPSSSPVGRLPRLSPGGPGLLSPAACARRWGLWMFQSVADGGPAQRVVVGLAFSRRLHATETLPRYRDLRHHEREAQQARDVIVPATPPSAKAAATQQQPGKRENQHPPLRFFPGSLSLAARTPSKQTRRPPRPTHHDPTHHDNCRQRRT